MIMLHKLLCLFGCLFLWVGNQPLTGKVIETNTIATVLDYADSDSLVFFDITNTLYKPMNTLSDKKWRTYLSEHAQAVLSDPKLAEQYANQIEGDIVRNIPKELVEANAPATIKQLQDKKVPVLSITRKRMDAPYAANFGKITADHLKSLGIDLGKSLEYFAVPSDEKQDDYTFAYGIIFTNKNPIGSSLETFLNHLKVQPKKIVMVENSLKYLPEIESLSPFCFSSNGYE